MPKNEMPAGALVLLVLRVLRSGPLHGYAIAQRIHALSSEVLRVEEGSLYPALHRMEESGWIGATWTVTELKRRARIYRITRKGSAHLAGEQVRWNDFAAGVARVLRHA